MNIDGRNFDNIADKFTQHIHGTQKGKLRQYILWEELTPLLATFPSVPLTVLDAGGGDGVNACKMAALGHNVIYCDVSEIMLEKAKQLADKRGVAHQIRFVCCAIQALETELNEQVDLILCHAVLEWICDQRMLLEGLKRLLKPQGVLSLMFYNYYGLFFKNVILGNFDYALLDLPKKKKRSLSPDYPIKPEQVDEWLSDLSLSTLSETGVRIFHDYVQNKAQRDTAFDQLLALELKYCRQLPYLQFARYIHLLVKHA